MCVYRFPWETGQALACFTNLKRATFFLLFLKINDEKSHEEICANLYVPVDLNCN